MADKYEVTMMYRVALPEGTEDVLTKEFNDDRDVSEVLTELISEVMADYQNTTATGKHYSNWVYLGDDHAEGEMWSRGWYKTDELPGNWEATTHEELYDLVYDRKSDLVRCLITGVEASNMSWIWEGE